MKKVMITLTLALTIALAGTAGADTLYDFTAATDGYFMDAGAYYTASAQTFLTKDSPVDSLTVTMSLAAPAGTDGDWYVSLYSADSADEYKADSAVSGWHHDIALNELTVGDPWLNDYSYGDYTFTFSGTALSANTYYWLVLTTNTANAGYVAWEGGAWDNNGHDTLGYAWESQGSWAPPTGDALFVATIETAAGGVDPVPEPATLTLLGLGLAGMATRRLRRKD